MRKYDKFFYENNLQRLLFWSLHMYSKQQSIWLNRVVKNHLEIRDSLLVVSITSQDIFECVPAPSWTHPHLPPLEEQLIIPKKNYSIRKETLENMKKCTKNHPDGKIRENFCPRFSKN